LVKKFSSSVGNQGRWLRGSVLITRSIEELNFLTNVPVCSSGTGFPSAKKAKRISSLRIPSGQMENRAREMARVASGRIVAQRDDRHRGEHRDQRRQHEQ
jgi:hypothetical protein